MHQRSISLPKSIPEPDVVVQETCSRELVPILSNAHRRWQLLSMALRSSWAFSQAKKIIANNQDAFLNTFQPRSPPSYTAIDIQPGTEYFSTVDKQRLSTIVKEENWDYLNHIGGVQGVVLQLKTDVGRGIEADAQALSIRQQTFGSNEIQMPSAKKFPVVMENCKDPFLVLVFLTALLSLGFGVKRDGLNGVYDGLFLFGFLIVVAAAISLSNIWAMTQFHALSKSYTSVPTVVIRDGMEKKISANDAVVGDIVCLKIGDQVPADGLYIDGSSFQVTNESALSEKANFEEFPFLLRGSKVVDGYARMIATAVGMDTKWGEMMNSKRLADIRTPLQVKLHKLTQNTAKVGLAVASFVLVGLLIQYFTGKMKDDSGARDYTSSKSSHHVYQDIIGILIMPIVIASTAVPEGLLLAVTITLAYSTKRMAADKAILRNLAACENMSSVSLICIDKQGAISSYSPEVEQFWLGQMFCNTTRNHPSIDEKVLQLIHEGIGLSTTSGLSSEFDELKSEKAIQAWAVQELGMSLDQLKRNCRVLDADRFNLPQGCICVQHRNENTVQIHMKGSMDMIFATCSHYLDKEFERKSIDASVREELMKNVEKMKNEGLNCIAYAYAHVADFDVNHFCLDLIVQDLTLVGFLGLRDRFLPYISKGLTEFQQAGVKVIMMTTDDVPKAKESALRCGVLNPNDMIKADDIIEGSQVRNYTEEGRNKTIENVCVIAKASASDKHLLVQCLKKKGHRVAVIGGCPGEEQVFEEADVSFNSKTRESNSMEEKSDVIILDDSFTPIASAMRWGRSMYNNIQIFAQFQLTATIVSLVADSLITIFGGEPLTINTVTVISSGKIPFAALQILWVKLIVGTLVVLALSIDDPAESLVQLMPRKGYSGWSLVS